MDRIRFISHQGNRILLIDLTNCSADDIINLMPVVQRMVTTQPRNSVMTLTDYTGAVFSREAVTRMKEVAVFDRPYVRRAAIVAAERLPEVYHQALKSFSQREFARFHSREEALDWLVREVPLAASGSET